MTPDLFVCVDGRNRSLFGKQRFLAFRLEAGWVEIKRLTFVKCGHSKAREGGAVRASNVGHFFLKKCTFVECNAKLGGAIFLGEEANCSIISTIFLNCCATNHGACIFSSGFTKLIKSTFSRCKATRGCGGAVFNNVGGSCEVTNCDFRGNYAQVAGSAFFNSPGSLALLCDNFWEGNSNNKNAPGKTSGFHQGL